MMQVALLTDALESYRQRDNERSLQIKRLTEENARLRASFEKLNPVAGKGQKEEMEGEAQKEEDVEVEDGPNGNEEVVGQQPNMETTLSNHDV